MNTKKLISGALTALLLLFAYFQLNDPDPEVWTPIYLLAAAVCFSVFINKPPHSFVFWLVAAAYLVGAIIQWPPQFEGVLFGEMKMRSLNIELARESLGLGICVVSVLVVGWLSKR